MWKGYTKAACRQQLWKKVGFYNTLSSSWQRAVSCIYLFLFRVGLFWSVCDPIKERGIDLVTKVSMRLEDQYIMWYTSCVISYACVSQTKKRAKRGIWVIYPNTGDIRRRESRTQANQRSWLGPLHGTDAGGRETLPQASAATSERARVALCCASELGGSCTQLQLARFRYRVFSCNGMTESLHR